MLSAPLSIEEQIRLPKEITKQEKSYLIMLKKRLEKLGMKVRNLKKLLKSLLTGLQLNQERQSLLNQTMTHTPLKTF